MIVYTGRLIEWLDLSHLDLHALDLVLRADGAAAPAPEALVHLAFGRGPDAAALLARTVEDLRIGAAYTVRAAVHYRCERRVELLGDVHITFAEEESNP